MVKLIDIHAHVNFRDFDYDREEIIEKTLANGIWFINVGDDFKSSKESVELANKYDGVFASVGVHPHCIDEGFDTNEYKKLALGENVVAIGECGLDYYKIQNAKIKNQNDNSKFKIKEKQKELFEKQIELALEVNKPLMIHCREAHDDVIEILNSEFIIQNSKLRGNVHFFTGKQKHVEKYLELGFTVSFTGVITFTNSYDEVIKNLPLEKMMVETDSPLVAPVPYRGKRNEPMYVKEVVKKIAKIKDLSYEEVAEQTTKNAIDFFGLK